MHPLFVLYCLVCHKCVYGRFEFPPRNPYLKMFRAFALISLSQRLWGWKHFPRFPAARPQHTPIRLAPEPGGTSRGRPAVKGKRTCGGRPGQHVEEQGTWASRTQSHSEAGYGRPVDRGAWTTKTVKQTRQQPAHPQYANYWAPLTRKRHTMPHPAQPQHTSRWAPRTWKRHQQEHRPQWPTESSDPTQHAKGRTGDRPGPRNETTPQRNVKRGGGSILQGDGTGAWDGTISSSRWSWPRLAPWAFRTPQKWVVSDTAPPLPPP